MAYWVVLLATLTLTTGACGRSGELVLLLLASPEENRNGESHLGQSLDTARTTKVLRPGMP